MTTQDKHHRCGVLINESRQVLESTEGTQAERDAKYDAIMAEYDTLRGQIQREERQAAAENATASPGPRAGREARSQAERALGVASEEYRTAFWSAMRTGVPEDFRALTVGTDTAGGFTVPDTFRSQFIEALDAATIVRPMATVFTTTTGILSIPVLSTHSSAAWKTEGQAYAESEPVFAEVQLNAYKLTDICKVSEELLNDSAFDLGSLMAREFGRALGIAQETAFINGDGSAKPTGMIQGSGLGKTAAATNAITADEIVDLYHSLARQYRARASFIMADGTIKMIRKLVTGVSGDKTYLWGPGLRDGEPDRLLGRPVYASEDMPAATSGLKPILFCDPSYYYIGDRQSIGMQRLVELYAANGHVGFRIFARTDGKVALAVAFKHLLMA